MYNEINEKILRCVSVVVGSFAASKQWTPTPQPELGERNWNVPVDVMKHSLHHWSIHVHARQAPP